MKRYLKPVVLLLSLALWLGGEPASLDLVRLGQSHDNVAGLESGEGWWGWVVQEDSTSSWLPVDLEVRRVPNKYDASLPQDFLFAGYLDGSKEPILRSGYSPYEFYGKPLFMVRGCPGFDTSIVQTADGFFPNSDLLLDEGVELELDGQTWRLFLQADSISEQWATGIHVMLENPSGEVRELESLHEWTVSVPYKILWAGDLDGDGKLDLVLNRGYHICISPFALYLSSMPGRVAAECRMTAC
ncbi:hypothetical protein KQI63_12300 [bacterium]|nr:hypothetical protein [bacterium]